MPYRKFTKKLKGKTLYCIQNLDTGKTYCSKSKAGRAKVIKLHEAFKHGWKPTGKAKS